MMNEMDAAHPPFNNIITTPEIVTVSYEDLIAFDQNYETCCIIDQSHPIPAAVPSLSSTMSWRRSDHSSHQIHDKLLLFEVLMKRIGYDAFGPHGLGIVMVENVPNFSKYRQALLPLAAQIPNIPNVEEICTDPKSYYQVGWSHGKEILSDQTTGTRQPDIYKGSYYANPFTNDLLHTLDERDGPERHRPTPRRHLDLYTKNKWPPSPHVPQLESAFCQMGQLLHSVGCIIAKVCDAYCRSCCPSGGDGGGGRDTHMASTIVRSKNANGRLLHYFPVDTTNVAKVSNNNHNNHTSRGDNDNDHTVDVPPQPTWCSWHNDHGLLTGLVPGMYIDARTGVDVTDCMHKNANNNSGGGGGLYIQARNGQCVHVPIPTNCCAYQIGETAQIMSGGLLQATPHAVFPPTPTADDAANYISRESFALFLEPEFDDVLLKPSSVAPSNEVRKMEDCGCGSNQTTVRLGLRSISERYQIGQTFGDFHLATVSTNATPT